MDLRGLILGLRGLILGLRGLILGLRGLIWGLRGASGGGHTYGRTYGRLEIHPCVLQDIGPLGPLPKNLNIKLGNYPSSTPFNLAVPPPNFRLKA